MGASRSISPWSTSFITAKANTGLLREAASNTLSSVTGSRVSSLRKPNPRLQTRPVSEVTATAIPVTPPLSISWGIRVSSSARTSGIWSLSSLDMGSRPQA
jgi:hypothetical protein